MKWKYVNCKVYQHKTKSYFTMNGRSYIFDPEMHWSYIHRVGSYYNGWKRVPGTTAMRYIK